MSPAPVQNEFPQPANARPPVAPATSALPTAPHPDTLARLFAPAGQETFTLDPDLRPVLEDMCQAALGRNWREGWQGWLSKMVSEALQNYLRG